MISSYNLPELNKRFTPLFHEALERVLLSGINMLGDETKNFEFSFAKYCNVKHCVAVANGLDALTLVMRAHIECANISYGDEVIVPANTYIATILSILENGLVPVLVEPELNTYNIDPKLIQQSITPRTKAIMVVHLYGLPAPMSEVSEIAKNHNLLVFEDAAQAHGAKYKGQSVGSISNAGCFSFFPGKNLGALGDAGAITTNDDQLADVIRSMRNYGEENYTSLNTRKYKNQYVGINSRIDELQAAFLSIKLPFLDQSIMQRRVIAYRYINEIKNQKITLPSSPEFHDHAWHLFIIRTEDRSKLQQFLADNGIHTMVHYPIPPHKQRALAKVNLRGLFPVTEMIHNQVLSLPIYPTLKDSEISAVIEAINRY